jgi:hypothetical protein
VSNSEDQLRYPVGKFSPKESYTREELSNFINTIEALPEKVETIARSFSAKQLETPYREGGWTARQVLHHFPDSHMNAYIRMKWTITEPTPLIKAYNEKLWAETSETKLDPVISINFLKALHVKWVALMRLFTPEDLAKEFIHPETGKHVRIDRMIATYAWHCDHHYGHLRIIAGKAK